MAKNLVEIILDSSGSMQEPAFDKIEKFIIAKALLNEILEDILFPSSSKIFIRYFRNCEVFKVNDYQEINYVEAGGTTPLFKAIAISAHNLIKHGNGYRKSIIILTDGEDSCGEFSKEEIIEYIKENTSSKEKDKIAIYIIQIGNVSVQAEKQFEYFTKETNGKKYFINFNQNISTVIFDIKKDFKSIFKLNQYIFKKIIWILRNFISFLVFILFFLSLSIYTINLEKKATTSIHKEVTSCSKKPVNGIDVTTCTFLKDTKTQAIIYTHKNLEVIIFKDFSSASSTFNQSRTLFLQDVFYSQMTPFKNIKNILLWGHSDLQRVKRDDNVDSENHYCKSNHIKINSNECLGTIRTLSVKNAIDKLNYPFSNISISYQNDFFMQNTNKILNGTLFKAMDLEDTVATLKKKLHINEIYNPQIVREEFKNKEETLNQYKEEFSPFRSVVVIIERRKSFIEIWSDLIFSSF